MGLVSSKSELEVQSTAPSTPGTESGEPHGDLGTSSCTSAPGLGFNLMSSSNSFSVSYGLSQIQVWTVKWKKENCKHM